MPIKFSASAPIAIPPLNSSAAKLATVVPLAALPKPLLLVTRTIPALMVVTPA